MTRHHSQSAGLFLLLQDSLCFPQTLCFTQTLSASPRLSLFQPVSLCFRLHVCASFDHQKEEVTAELSKDRENVMVFTLLQRLVSTCLYFTLIYSFYDLEELQFLFNQGSSKEI